MRILFSLLALSCSMGVILGGECISQAQITPDGGTATSIFTHPDGTTAVSIAPVISDGLSYNSYSSFSVGSDGVYIDNRAVGAHSIVNEVTSNLRSHLLGPIEILGSRAHFILANPNGITVNGTEFINTGGVALGAGTINLVNRTIAPGLTQLNAVLTTNNKDILVEGTGLSGAVTSMQLYAGSIRVDGPITNSDSDPTASIGLVAGNTQVEFDSAVLPLSSVQNWAQVTDLGGSSSDVLIDVTPKGSLSASKVYMSVNAKGAGVSFAGNGYASVGDFTISSTGQISMANATIKARQNVKFRGNSIDATSYKANRAAFHSRQLRSVQTKIEAVNGGLLMLAQSGDISNIGGIFQGVTRDSSDSDMLGGVTLNATGSISLLTENADQLAIAFASNDDLMVKAGSDITNTHGRLLSNEDVHISSQNGNFRNQVIVLADSDRGKLDFEQSSKPIGYLFNLLKRRKKYWRQDFGTLSVPEQIAYVVGDNVSIQADQVVNQGGEIDANDGSVTINARIIHNEAEIIGSLNRSRTCVFVCWDQGTSDIRLMGGHINASKDITLTATETLTDIGGQMLAFGDLNLNAQSISITGKRLTTVVERPGGLKSLFLGKRTWVYEEDLGGIWMAPLGAINVVSPKAIDVSAGQISWGKALNAPNGINQLSNPAIVSPVQNNHLGFFWYLFDDD